MRHIFFWLLGGLLFYLAFRNQNIGEIWEEIQQANWYWVLAITGISLLTQLLRVLRWRLLLQPLGYKVSVGNAFTALQAGYLMSLAVPRMGELTRCLAVSKQERLPFKPLFGTVIIERLVDIACLALVACFAFFIEFDYLYDLYLQEVHPSIVRLFQEKTMAVKVVGTSFVLGGALLFSYILWQWKRLRKYAWWRLTLRFGLQVWKGVASIQKIERRGVFILYTLLIWVGYYFMTSLWFFCFSHTSNLGWDVGLAMLVVGSVGRSLPIQGGAVGAYHYIYQQGMMLYGVSAVYGGTLAIMTHGLQLLLTLILGALSSLYLMGTFQIQETSS